MIEWLRGLDEPALGTHLAAPTTFEDFFVDATVNPNASLTAGVVWGGASRTSMDPLMQRIRHLVELAKGEPMTKALRGAQ